MSKELESAPRVVISRRGADRIRAGHVWVYRSDVLQADGIPPGALVTLVTALDKPVRRETKTGATGTRVLGSALYSTSSEIAVRLISRKPVVDLEQLIRDRMQAAIAYRERFVQNSNAYRVVFGEGDFLPGLIVDRYHDVLVFQVLTQAMDAGPTRDLVLAELKAAFSPRAIVERVDARVRKLEQLPEKESGAVFQSTPADETRNARLDTEFQMNGVRFHFDALSGQKTGAFLDQRENYAAVERYARGDALDVFCYQGGFALHLARVCQRVTGIDSSRPALEAAEQNAALNGREIEWIEANAFDYLRDLSNAGQQYDCIVLDPPAFAKSRQNLPAALRGYKELNLRAMKMLRSGGILATCSCSYHVSAQDLLEVTASAARDSHRILRILENRGQASDHPSVLGIPETAYLKCIVMHVTLRKKS